MTADGAPSTGADDAHVANEDEVTREFSHGDGRSLSEQMPLVDEDGDDIRQYTGEPVETEDGWVVPQQMATGSENVVGGGEFPNTPDESSDGSSDESRDE